MNKNVGMSNVVGEYNFGFFIIQIYNGFDFENLENNNEDEWGTMYHEYIHFLQEVSTTFGLFNLHCILLEMLILIYKSQETYYSYVEEQRKQWELEIELCNCVIGETGTDSYNEYKDIMVNSICIKKDEILEECLNYSGIELANINITMYSTDNKMTTKNIIFGSRIIMESMASLMEQKITFIKMKGKYVQYSLAELICEKIYPAIFENKNYIIALCEVALMYINPGAIFVNLLEDMNKEEFMPNNELDIYKYASEILCTDKYQKIDVEREYNRWYKECDIDIRYLLQGEFFKELSNTLRNMMKIGKEQGMLVFFKLLKAKKENAIDTFLEVQNILPPISILDKKLQMFTGIKKEQVGEVANVFDVLALKSVYSELLDKKRECNMYDICKSDNSDRIREHCLNLPINNNDIRKGCPVSDICNYLGLKKMFK